MLDNKFLLNMNMEFDLLCFLGNKILDCKCLWLHLNCNKIRDLLCMENKLNFHLMMRMYQLDTLAELNSDTNIQLNMLNTRKMKCLCNKIHFDSHKMYNLLLRRASKFQLCNTCTYCPESQHLLLILLCMTMNTSRENISHSMDNRKLCKYSVL